MKKTTMDTPLLKELTKKNFPAVRELLAHNKDLNTRGAWDTSPLHFALGVAQEHPDIIEQMISAGAEVNSPGEFILGTAVLLDYSPKIIETLLAAGADINQTDSAQLNALYYAVRRANLATMELLLRRGIALHPPDAPHSVFELISDQQGYENTSYAMYELLLAHGGGPYLIKTGGYKTALQNRAFHGDARFVELLLQHGAPVNALLPNNNTLLTQACLYGQNKIIELALRYGADSNQRATNGLTPLMHAVLAGKVNNIRLLLKARSDVKLKTAAGQTALMLAHELKGRQASPIQRAALENIIKALSAAEKKSSIQRGGAVV